MSLRNIAEQIFQLFTHFDIPGGGEGGHGDCGTQPHHNIDACACARTNEIAPVDVAQLKWDFRSAKVCLVVDQRKAHNAVVFVVTFARFKVNTGVLRTYSLSQLVGPLDNNKLQGVLFPPLSHSVRHSTVFCASRYDASRGAL